MKRLIRTPQVGDIWVCKKDVVMNFGNKETAYKNGCEYKCEQTNCLTDEQKDTSHFVYNPQFAPIKWLNEFFKLKNK